jgi:hypothetical protein
MPQKLPDHDTSSIPKTTMPPKTGWWLTYPSEKYEFVSWDDEIPNIWKVIKFHGSKPPNRKTLDTNSNDEPAKAVHLFFRPSGGSQTCIKTRRGRPTGNSSNDCISLGPSCQNAPDPDSRSL